MHEHIYEDSAKNEVKTFTVHHIHHDYKLDQNENNRYAKEDSIYFCELENMAAMLKETP